MMHLSIADWLPVVKPELGFAVPRQAQNFGSNNPEQVGEVFERCW
jgi:hypothetical protein